MSRGSTIPDQVAKQIQALIRTGEFAPGSALPAQRDLADRFGVSRASLREALASLETLGLVRVQAGKGVFVEGGETDSPRPRQARDHDAAVYQFRLAIEPFVAGLAAQYAGSAQIAAIADSVARMRAALAEDDLVDAARMDFEFHQGLVTASGNPLFARAMLPAAEALQESSMLPYSNRAKVMEPLQEHEAILDCIRRHNPSAAQDAMHRHILSSARRAGITVLRP